MHPNSRESSLPTSKAISFASVGLVLGFLLIAVQVFLPPILASHLGVSLTTIGSAWAIVRVFDIAVDPALGFIIDRTKLTLGRYRSWLVLGAPVLMAAIWALFEAPVGVGFPYLLAWLLVFYLGISILTVVHSAWAANLVPDYDGRSRLFGLIAMLNVVGGVFVLGFPLLANVFGWTSAQAVQAMGVFAVAATPVVVFIVVLRTPEARAMGEKDAHDALADLWRLLSKPDLIRLLAAQITLTLGPGWMSALYLFFFTQSRGFSLDEASILLLVYMVAGVLGAFLTARVAIRLTKHRTLIATAVAFALGLCSVAVIPKGNLIATAPAMLWSGFMAAGFEMMIRAMLADVADEVRLDHGRDQISLIYALNSAANKLAAALAIGLTFPLLAGIGFNPAEGARNSVPAIHGLEFAFILGPIGFVLLGALSMAGWRLDPARHAGIRAALQARDGVHLLVPIMETLTPDLAVATTLAPRTADPEATP